MAAIQHFENIATIGHIVVLDALSVFINHVLNDASAVERRYVFPEIGVGTGTPIRLTL
jgi:hypothetical protein